MVHHSISSHSNHSVTNHTLQDFHGVPSRSNIWSTNNRLRLRLNININSNFRGNSNSGPVLSERSNRGSL